MRYRAVGAFMLTVVLVTSASAVEQADCPQADQNFLIWKTDSWYDLEYKGSQIHRIEPAQLKDLFGGKTPTVDCDVALSSRDVMGVVVGWKKDLLIAFGVVRDQSGRPVRVNKLSWVPHAGSFDPIILKNQSEFIVRYGTFVTRICWNRGGRQRWEFSNQQTSDDPGPCSTMDAPFGADQYLIPVQ